MKRVFLIFLMVGMVSVAAPLHAQDEPVLPLSEPGPYGPGRTTATFIDSTRADRELVTEIWYPAILSEDDSLFGFRSIENAEPDTSGAPYPLIIYSHGDGESRKYIDFLAKYVVSYGFVVAAMDHPNDIPAAKVVDRPLDMLFVLDQLAALDEGNLVGMIDTDHTGVWGYSSGAATVLSLSGAQVDPDYFVAWATEHSDDTTGLYTQIWSAWDELAAYHAQISPVTDGELWPPFSDERIRAVLPIAPCFTPLFGERGLAAATVPTLIIAGETDWYCPYERNAVFMAEHLGSEDVNLITEVGKGHTAGSDDEVQPALRHFTTAFFGTYLQGHEDYATYLTESYVNGVEGLVWGVVESE
jgi:predicted dienelactone hydrolase